MVHGACGVQNRHAASTALPSRFGFRRRDLSLFLLDTSKPVSRAQECRIEKYQITAQSPTMSRDISGFVKVPVLSLEDAGASTWH